MRGCKVVTKGDYSFFTIAEHIIGIPRKSGVAKRQTKLFFIE